VYDGARYEDDILDYIRGGWKESGKKDIKTEDEVG
jgi:hypothetical protein